MPMIAPAEGVVLDLADWRGDPKVRVLTGRARGYEVRNAAGLAQLDVGRDSVEVRVPLDLFSVTSSFFLGLFGESIRILGEHRFRAHYRFTGKPIERVIDDSIRSVALTTPIE